MSFANKWEENVRRVEPYVPGEQPKESGVIKLNTNENPYPPAPAVREILDSFDVSRMRLYPTPDADVLVEAIAERYGVKKSQIFVGVGSDDVISMAFMTFFGSDKPILFPNITYSFYDVWAEVYRIPYETKPLRSDMTIDPEDYKVPNGGIIFPNPNAPTGVFESVGMIEEIVKANPDSVVMIDEAYIDFGGESCLPLIEKYDNLLVTQTFSKSRSLAGGRLGFIMGAKDLIADLNTLRNASNPYNVNRMTAKAGIVTLRENTYFKNSCHAIQFNRRYTRTALEKLGFEVLPSSANFLFVRSDRIGGEELYLALKERGVLVRHFSDPKISDWNRVTIGTKVQMDIFLQKVEEIFKKQDEERAAEEAHKARRIR